MNHHDRPSLTLHHEVQSGVVNLYEQRFCPRMIMSDAARDVSFFKPTGDFHDVNWTRDLCITSRKHSVM
jgi:hypothetical protein